MDTAVSSRLADASHQLASEPAPFENQNPKGPAPKSVPVTLRLCHPRYGYIVVCLVVSFPTANEMYFLDLIASNISV